MLIAKMLWPVLAAGTAFAGVAAATDHPPSKANESPPVEARGATVRDGQARYLHASGVDPAAVRFVARMHGRDVAVVRAPGRACVVESGGAALCADEADIDAGRAASFVACAPGMATGDLRITGLAPRDATRARIAGQRASSGIQEGAFTLDAEVPSDRAPVRVALTGGARDVTVVLPVPSDLRERSCGA